MPAICLLTLLLALQGPAQLPVLRPGETVEGRVGGEAQPVHSPVLDAEYQSAAPVGQAVRLQVGETGTYHLELRSWFFDSYLVLRDSDGTVIAEDDDGLTDARASILHSQIVLELEAGRDYWADACALHGDRGGFELSLTSGRPRMMSRSRLASLERQDAERRVEVMREHHGKEHPETAKALNNLGEVLRIAGRLQEAAPVHEEALAIRERVFGPTHEVTAQSLNNLGVLCGQLGAYEEGRAHLERCLAIDSENFGPEHEETLAVLSNLATITYDMGDYARTREILEFNLDVRSRGLPPNHPDLARSLSNLGILSTTMGDFTTARSYLERALGIREEAFGPLGLPTAESLQNLASLLARELGEPAAARPLLERAMEIFEHEYGSRHPSIGYCLDVLGDAFDREGNLVEARGSYERALAIRERALGPKHPDTATTLDKLGGVLADLGEHEAGREMMERSLRIREEQFGPNHPATISGMLSLAGLHAELEQRQEALRLYERALVGMERSTAPTDPMWVEVLFPLALMISHDGEFERALDLLERARSIYSFQDGPESEYLAFCLSATGHVLFQLGRFDEARLRLEEAVAVHEAAGFPDRDGLINALNTTSTVHLALQNLEAAEEVGRRAVSLAEANDSMFLPLTLSHLAEVLALRGNCSDAVELQQRALESMVARFGAEQHRVLEVQQGLAHALDCAGRAEEARRVYAEILAIREENQGREHSETALTRHSLALSLIGAGQPVRALELLREALDDLIQVKGPAHHDVVVVENDLIELLLQEERFEDVRELLGRAASDRFRHDERILAALSEAERFSYLRGLERGLTYAMALADHEGRPAAEIRAYEALLACKGRVGRLAVTSRRRLAAGMSDEQRELVQALRRIQSDASYLSSLVDSADPEVHARRVASVREERNRLEVELSRTLEGVGETTLPGFEAVRAALPEGSALIDFLSYHPYQLDGLCADEHRVAAWVVLPERDAPARLDLGLERDLRAAIRQHLTGLRRRAEDSRGVAVVAGKPAGTRSLRGLLWEPLEPLLGDADTILISPDGALCSLPFETIRLADGRFALEDHAFVYLQGEPVLGAAPQGRSLDAALIVGGVDFDGPSSERGKGIDPEGRSPWQASSETWQPLPATWEESRRVALLHEERYGEGGSRQILSGVAASEARLKRELPGQDVLHLATHGFFNPEGVRSLLEASHVETGRDLGFVGDVERLHGQLPGLLSGLVLAGANAPRAVGEDGYLTAEEVGWLDLSGVELVVLSACDTGLGREQSGEGLLGLRRAFQLAGARTVVSSLWSVQDESTAALMQGFYENLWVRGLPPGEALRQAQLAMLERNRREHGDPLPATWGAFVLSGEWR